MLDNRNLPQIGRIRTLEYIPERDGPNPRIGGN